MKNFFLKILIIFTYNLLFFNLLYSQIKELKETWSHNIDTTQTLFIQESKQDIFLFNGVSIFNLNPNGNIKKIRDYYFAESEKYELPLAFYLNENKMKFYTINCRKWVIGHFSNGEFHEYDLLTEDLYKSRLIALFPDFNLYGWHPEYFDLRFTDNEFRLVYQIVPNLYYFQINLEKRNLKGNISLLKSKYACLSNKDFCVYLYNDFGYESALSLYDFKKDTIFWKIKNVLWPLDLGSNTNNHSIYNNNYFHSTQNKIQMVDIDGINKTIYKYKDDSKTIASISPDNKYLSYITDDEILFINNEGKLEWSLNNNFNAKRIVKFDSLGLIVADYSDSLSTFRSISNHGNLEWKVKTPRYYNRNKIYRSKDNLIIFFDDGLIKGYKIKDKS